MRTQLELPNEVAAELAGPGDAIMRTLEEHLDCEVFLRGNVLTLDGSDEDVAMGRTVVRELNDLVQQGHEIAPGTIEAIAGARGGDPAGLGGREPDAVRPEGRVAGDGWSARSN